MEYLNKIFSWNRIESSHRLMLLIVFLMGFLNFLFGEKTWSSNGFGWDGVIYADLVRNIDVLISTNQLSNYYAHRSLPAFIVRMIMLICNIPMSDNNIVQVFELFNFGLLMASCFLWIKISDRLNLSLVGRWIGFSGLFLNFANSKFIFYLPVLTDTAAFFTGMALLYLYLEKKPFLMTVTALLGAFCWPSVGVSAALLLFFLYFEFPKHITAPENSRLIIKDKINKTLLKGGLVILIFSILARGLCKFLNLEPKSAPFFTGLPVDYFLVLGLFILLGSFNFLSALWSLRKKVSIKLVVLALVVLVVPAYVGRLISNPELPNPNTLSALIELMLLPPDNKFFLSPLTLALYWGPLVLLLIMYWRVICIQVRRLGPGVVALIAIHLPLATMCEPRFMTIAWPFLVISLVLATEGIKVKSFFKPLWVALIILFSKFWLVINWEPWHEGLYVGLQQYPKQLLFMHLGLWTSWISYGWQLPLVILAAVLLRRSIIQFKN